MENAVELDGIAKRFGKKTAVESVTLTIAPGETYGLVGRNGAGKTTTIRMINGLIRPDRGTVMTLGGTPASVRGQMGYLPEERGLYPDMNALEMAVYMGELRQLDRREAQKRARARLEEWRIDPKQRIHRLSKGMAQAVQIIGTTLHDRELLTLDEPFSGLDPIAQSKLEQLVQARRKQGLTTILSTHVMSQAERLCDRLTIIDQGVVKYSGDMSSARRTLPQQGHVKITGASEAAIRSVLGPDAQLQEGAWVFPVANGGQYGSQLIRALTDIGQVEDFSIERASLHNVFVHLVGEQETVQPEVVPAGGLEQ